MGVTRSMKRKILRKHGYNTQDLSQRIDYVQNHVLSTAISMTINILYGRGWSEDELWEIANEMVDEYEQIKDFDVYAELVLERTGVGVKSTEDAEHGEQCQIKRGEKDEG